MNSLCHSPSTAIYSIFFLMASHLFSPLLLSQEGQEDSQQSSQTGGQRGDKQATSLSTAPHSHIVVQNRILAKVNGKMISTLDVMKRMDAFLLKYYPDHFYNDQARYQFLATEWKMFLEQIVSNELILMDGVKLEAKIPEVEVRKEIMERFGPNLMNNLDQLGMTYDEARQLVEDEIIIQNVNWLRVHSKALQKVNPEMIRQSYEEYRKEHPAEQNWSYEVLTISGKDDSLASSLGAKALDLLDSVRYSLPQIAQVLKENGVSEQEQKYISISTSEQTASEKTISPHLKEILTKLKPGEHSPLISQKSRVDQKPVHRIYTLKEQSRTEVPSFDAIASGLQDTLLQKIANEESARYIDWLKKKFENPEILSGIPPDYQPFVFVP